MEIFEKIFINTDMPRYENINLDTYFLFQDKDKWCFLGTNLVTRLWTNVTLYPVAYWYLRALKMCIHLRGLKNSNWQGYCQLGSKMRKTVENNRPSKKDSVFLARSDVGLPEEVQLPAETGNLQPTPPPHPTIATCLGPESKNIIRLLVQKTSCAHIAHGQVITSLKQLKQWCHKPKMQAHGKNPWTGKVYWIIFEKRAIVFDPLYNIELHPCNKGMFWLHYFSNSCQTKPKNDVADLGDEGTRR